RNWPSKDLGAVDVQDQPAPSEVVTVHKLTRPRGSRDQGACTWGRRTAPEDLIAAEAQPSAGGRYGRVPQTAFQDRLDDGSQLDGSREEGSQLRLEVLR